jgi:type VI protein secretion system component VasK
MSLSWQIVALFLLSIPVACVSWTVTHEEVFREPREFCVRRSESCRRWWERKFFYLFTCEYCFSHYVAVFLLAVTRYHLLYEDWRGYLVGGLALVWVANLYMSLYGRLRLDIKSERIEAEIKEKVAEKTGRSDED